MNKIILLILALLTFSCLFSHHFKGLPHFNYFENYPQVPQDEYLAEKNGYEYSLVIYDFQGIQKMDAEQPDDVRLYLAIYNLGLNAVYKKELIIEVLDKKEVIHSKRYEESEEESIYTLNLNLNDKGEYQLRVRTLIDGVEVVIPFLLSSQKFSYEYYISGALLLILTIVIFGARMARIKQDRIDHIKEKKKRDIDVADK